MWKKTHKSVDSGIFSPDILTSHSRKITGVHKILTIVLFYSSAPVSRCNDSQRAWFQEPKCNYEITHFNIYFGKNVHYEKGTDIDIHFLETCLNLKAQV